MLTKKGRRERLIQLLATVLVAFAAVGIAVPASAATGQAHRAVVRAHPAGAAPVANAGHYFVEDQPGAVIRGLTGFFG